MTVPDALSNDPPPTVNPSENSDAPECSASANADSTMGSPGHNSPDEGPSNIVAREGDSSTLNAHPASTIEEATPTTQTSGRQRPISPAIRDTLSENLRS
ncbi:hypothetical protein RQCS_32430 [Rhodococcus qingshengii]|nr:hypothetical protein RQCS_32430 [Rhodococcus qingshengii]